MLFHNIVPILILENISEQDNVPGKLTLTKHQTTKYCRVNKLKYPKAFSHICVQNMYLMYVHDCPLCGLLHSKYIEDMYLVVPLFAGTSQLSHNPTDNSLGGWNMEIWVANFEDHYKWSTAQRSRHYHTHTRIYIVAGRGHFKHLYYIQQ